MTLKQYNIYRIAIIVILAFSISISITLENYYLPIVLIVAAMAFMYYIRNQLQTTEVMADERDYKLAGDSARYTITMYGLIGVVVMFVLMGTSSGKEDISYILSQYLAFSICFLMILNVLVFKYLRSKK